MKCYFFGKRRVGAPEDLGRAKQELAGELDELWKWTQTDAQKRAKEEKS
jgi:hypothetical protein